MVSEEKYKKDLASEINEKIPEKFRRITTDKQKLLQEVLAGMNKKRSYFVTGAVGTGKTVFLYALAKQAIEEAYAAGKIRNVWVRQAQAGYYESDICVQGCPGMVMSLQGACRDADGRPESLAKGIARSPILFLDDIGVEKATEYVRQMIYFIINEREQWEMPTLFTSNLSLAQLGDRFDDRIASRIKGMCEVLKFTGKDRR